MLRKFCIGPLTLLRSLEYGKFPEQRWCANTALVQNSSISKYFLRARRLRELVSLISVLPQVFLHPLGYPDLPADIPITLLQTTGSARKTSRSNPDTLPRISSRYFSVNCCMAFSCVAELDFNDTVLQRRTPHPHLAGGQFAPKAHCATTADRQVRSQVGQALPPANAAEKLFGRRKRLPSSNLLHNQTDPLPTAGTAGQPLF
jgi:hypothetical protein